MCPLDVADATAARLRQNIADDVKTLIRSRGLKGEL